MLPFWDMVDALLGGADAIRAGGVTYLPKFPNESQADYDYRLENAKFTNLYSDIAGNLASKPFAEKLTLGDDASERMLALAEDIDGRGNNIHVFAAATFFGGINYAVDWILVDHTRVKPGARLDEERRIGARPYWVRIPAKRMLAAYTGIVAGSEAVVHARVREDYVERRGYEEVIVERIRIFDRAPVEDADGQVVGYAPATFEVLERRVKANGATAWDLVAAGPITIGVIPLVPFITGRRIDGSWRFTPPLKDAAFLQVEHYQQETKLKCAADRTAFPLLAAEGVEPDRDESGNPRAVSISPGAVVYAPPNPDGGSHGQWNFKEPSATSLRFLADQIAVTEQQMRELGRQPLTAAQGITVVSAAYAGQKASSAVQAWAWALKDALEQAFVLTAAWLREGQSPTVKLFTDFALEIGDDKGPETLSTMRAAGDLSQETLWTEMKRRNILSADFDVDAERDRLLGEMPGDGDDDDLAAAVTQPAAAPVEGEPEPEPEPEDIAA
jgi:hypothetical protein